VTVEYLIYVGCLNTFASAAERSAATAIKTRVVDTIVVEMEREQER